MGMKKAAIIMCAALSLSGCAGYSMAYEGSGGSDEKTQAMADCRARVDQSSILATEDENGTWFSKARENLLMSCMEGHGYRLSPNFEWVL